ncbi:hypothetical protein GJ629_02535 [Halapricum sp. CBA1109]|uniref:hypothetical protein n=1 Tax=Halapricum sp. CBA1109 TaxID=2668068 RepID=UPI0012FBFFDC|nr:hypothetical protein [Halapricum sp. CBA1109]MUV88910.1 hypothetical protein [Halapricum sp. CBA1109]
MQTRRELVAGLGGAILLAGCTSSGGEDGTTDAPASSTRQPATAPETATPEPTTSEPTETTTEEPPEQTPTETESGNDPANQMRSFETVYHERNSVPDSVKRTITNNWDDIVSDLEQDGHDLSNLEVTSELLEDTAGHAGKQVETRNGIAAYRQALHNQLGLNTEQVFLNPYHFDTGGQRQQVTQVFRTEDDGAVKIENYRPGGHRQQENDEGDFISYLSENEEEIEGAEETIQDTWTPGEDREVSANRTATVLDTDAFKQLVRTIWDGNIGGNEGYEMINRRNDALLPWPTDGNVDIIYTADADAERSRILDFKNANDNPYTVGPDAKALVQESARFADAFVEDEAGTYMQVDYVDEVVDYDDPVEEDGEIHFGFNMESRGGSIIMETVGEERKEELKDAPFRDFP